MLGIRPHVETDPNNDDVLSVLKVITIYHGN